MPLNGCDVMCKLKFRKVLGKPVCRPVTSCITFCVEYSAPFVFYNGSTETSLFQVKFVIKTVLQQPSKITPFQGNLFDDFY